MAQQAKKYRLRADAETFSSNPNQNMKKQVSPGKKVPKTEEILTEVKLLKEKVNTMIDRTQNDKFMLTHQSQELEVVKSEVAYIRGKQAKLMENALIKAGNVVTRVLNMIPLEIFYITSGIILTVVVFKLMGILKEVDIKLALVYPR